MVYQKMQFKTIFLHMVSPKMKISCIFGLSESKKTFVMIFSFIYLITFIIKERK